MLLTERHNLFGREMVAGHLTGFRLRDVVVLTVQTTEIAARAGKAQTLGAWMKMIERLLLYRVDGERTRSSINFADQLAFDVSAAAAQACLAVGNATMVRTKQTTYNAIVNALIIRVFHASVQ